MATYLEGFQRGGPMFRRSADSYDIDFDQGVLDQKSGRSNRGARRRHCEVFPPHLVKPREVVEVDQEHLGLNNLLERAAGGGKRALEVFHDVFGLQLDVGTTETDI